MLDIARFETIGYHLLGAAASSNREPLGTLRALVVLDIGVTFRCGDHWFEYYASGNSLVKRVVGEERFELSLSCFRSRPEKPDFRTPRYSAWGAWTHPRAIAVGMDVTGESGSLFFLACVRRGFEPRTSGLFVSVWTSRPALYLGELPHTKIIVARSIPVPALAPSGAWPRRPSVIACSLYRPGKSASLALAEDFTTGMLGYEAREGLKRF